MIVGASGTAVGLLVTLQMLICNSFYAWACICCFSSRGTVTSLCNTTSTTSTQRSCDRIKQYRRYYFFCKCDSRSPIRAMDELNGMIGAQVMDNCLDLDQQGISLPDCAANIKSLPSSLHPTHCAALVRALHGFLESRVLLDVVVNCCDGVCAAHRLVLAAFSPTLQVLLMEAGAMAANHPLCIVLEDIHFSDMETLISYMYTGVLSVPETTATLLCAAQQLGMVDVASRIQLGKLDPESEDYDSNTAVSSSETTTTTQTPTADLESAGGEKRLGKDGATQNETSTGAESIFRNEHDEDTEAADDTNEQRDVPCRTKPQKPTSQQEMPLKVDSLIVESNNIIDVPFEFDASDDSQSPPERTKYGSASKVRSGDSVSQNTRHRNKRRPVLLDELIPVAKKVYKSSARKMEKKSRLSLKASSKIYESTQKKKISSRKAKMVSVAVKQEPQESSSPLEPTEIDLVESQTAEPTAETQVSESDGSDEVKTNCESVKEETHDCADCDFVGKNKSHLKRHLLAKHSDEKPFLCPHCDKTFKMKRYLKEHLRIHTDERPFECDVCGARFRAAKNRSRHKLIHTGEKKHTCELCGKRFNSSTALNKHRLIHSGERPYACSVEGCHYAAVDESLLKTHVKHRHNANRQLILCDSCGKAFKTKQSLKCHILAVHESAIFNCPHCPYESRFQTGITSHVKRIHGLNLNGKLAPPSFNCDQCDFACFTRHEFTRHVRNHRGEKPYQCPICPFATVEKMNLKFHMRIHTGEKPHECKICHRKFPRTMGLKRHMLTHTSEKPHQCDFCSSSYADKKSLETHRNVKHLHTQPFICHVCAYATVKKETLVQHLRKAHQIETSRQKQRRMAHQPRLGHEELVEGDKSLDLQDNVTGMDQSLTGEDVSMETVVLETQDKRHPQVIIQQVSETVTMEAEDGTEPQYETYAIYSMDGNTVELTPLLMQQK